MTELFLHYRRHWGEAERDDDKDIFIRRSTKLTIYANQPNLDFSDICYWNALYQISKLLPQDEVDEIDYNLYVPMDRSDYNGHNFEDNCFDLTLKMCQLLNDSIGRAEFCPFELKPCRSYDHWSGKIFFYNPMSSPCCYDITQWFRGFENRISTMYHESYISNIRLHRSIERERSQQKDIDELQKRLEDAKTHRAWSWVSHLQSRDRVISYCEFVRYLILNRMFVPNENIALKIPPRIADCVFEQDPNQTFEICKNHYFLNPEPHIFALNIAYELGDTSLFNHLIDEGEYLFVEGKFEDVCLKDFLNRTECGSVHWYYDNTWNKRKIRIDSSHGGYCDIEEAKKHEYSKILHFAQGTHYIKLRDALSKLPKEDFKYKLYEWPHTESTDTNTAE